MRRAKDVRRIVVEVDASIAASRSVCEIVSSDSLTAHISNCSPVRPSRGGTVGAIKLNSSIREQPQRVVNPLALLERRLYSLMLSKQRARLPLSGGTV